jgi:putative NADPH-quinone reductase
MTAKILIIDGHPETDRQHYVHALAAAYQEGARAGHHEIRRIVVGDLNFPLLRSNADFLQGTPPEDIKTCQAHIKWANHLVVVYPLWLGCMPALLKAFFEQTLRPGFAFAQGAARGFPEKRLKGRTARIVVTMGMPSPVYRWFFRAHSVKSLERNIFHFCGISPTRVSLVGAVEAMSDDQRSKWMASMRRLGRAAA